MSFYQQQISFQHSHIEHRAATCRSQSIEQLPEPKNSFLLLVFHTQKTIHQHVHNTCRWTCTQSNLEFCKMRQTDVAKWQLKKSGEQFLCGCKSNTLAFHSNTSDHICANWTCGTAEHKQGLFISVMYSSIFGRKNQAILLELKAMPKTFKQFTSSWMERPLTTQLKAIPDSPANQNTKQPVTILNQEPKYQQSQP